ncbi:MAG: glycosyltransferase [Phycisphaerae bacterium]|nr:glycosyltransferase [Phycisphaerae bacterium]
MPIHILIAFRSFWWLLFGLHRKKLQKIWGAYKFGGIRLCWYIAIEKFGRNYSYDHKQNQLSPTQSKYVLTKCIIKPLISIIVPVYKIDCKWLDKCIKSVINQHCGNWELILVDDASQKSDLNQLMDRWAAKEKRIRVYYLKENLGIAGATNFGIHKAKGQFIAFLDHDDELTEDALTWVTFALNKNQDALWLYSDEDLISVEGKCHSPRFKPDFSPEFLLSNMYTCHFRVYSAKVLRNAGGLRLGFDGSQDHDLDLRLSEIIPKEKIIHIPRVLYHWREVPGSAAIGVEAKPKAPSAGRKAVADSLERRGIKGKVTSYELCSTIYRIEFEPSSFPEVSIIIPTKNAFSLVKRCIDSARKFTNYPNYEIVIINNASDDIDFLEYLKKEQSEKRIKVIDYAKSFNHSEINNIAVNSVDSEFVVFMNNDIEIFSENWLEQLVAVTELDESIAVAGGLLVYPNGTVQHSGIILGINRFAGHAHKHIHSGLPGYLGRLHTLQEMSGITAALALVRRSSFKHVGGFDSSRYPTLYNDVDLCIRLRKNGYRCIYNPMVKAIHYETKTRPVQPEDWAYKKRLRDDYAEILNSDPFYNPNLSLSNEQFRGFRAFPIEKQIPELSNIIEECCA